MVIPETELTRCGPRFGRMPDPVEGVVVLRHRCFSGFLLFLVMFGCCVFAVMQMFSCFCIIMEVYQKSVLEGVDINRVMDIVEGSRSWTKAYRRKFWREAYRMFGFIPREDEVAMYLHLSALYLDYVSQYVPRKEKKFCITLREKKEVRQRMKGIYTLEDFSLGARDLSRDIMIFSKERCDVGFCPLHYTPSIVAQGLDSVKAVRVGNNFYFENFDNSEIVTLPLSPDDWRKIVRVKDMPFVRQKLEEYLANEWLDRLNAYISHRTWHRAGSINFWFDLILGSRRVRDRFFSAIEAPIITQGGDNIEEQVKNLMKDNKIRSTLCIAKTLGLRTKKDVNPTLYALNKRGILYRVQKQNPVLWRMCLVTQGDDRPIDEVSSITKEANLTFIDERPTDQDSTHTGGEISAKDPHADMSETPWNLNEVLTREIIVGHVSWSTASKIFLQDYAIPQCITNKSNAMVTKQLRLFAFARFGVEFRIQMNGTKFHQGRIMCALVPPMWGDDESFYRIENYSAFPHVFLDASVSNSGKLMVPFTHLLSHFPQKKGSLENDSICTLGRLRLIVFNKLRMGEDASSSLYITVFARLINPEMHQIVYPFDTFSYSDGIVTQGADEGFFKTLMTRTLPGVLGSFLNGMTGGLATGIGSALKGLIFDKPLEVLPPPPMVNRSVDPLCHGAGFDHSTRLALCPISETVTTETTLGGSTGDFDLKALLEMPSLLYTSGWIDTMGEGADIINFPICPTYLPVSRIDASPTGACVYSPTMLAYISRSMVYWRGSINLKIQVIATQFHSGRLAFIFDPTNLVDGPQRELDDLMNLNVIIMDIQEQQEMEIEIPFMSVRPWLRCDNFRSIVNFSGENELAEKLAMSCNGRFHVRVLNRLVSPASVANIVDINIFIKAGKDFELSVPCPLWPLSLSPPNDNPWNYGELEDYPFIIGSTDYPVQFENREMIIATYFEGRRLYMFGKLLLVKGKKWYESQKKIGLGDDEETVIWLYKASMLQIYMNGVIGPQGRLMDSFPNFDEKYPIVTQGAEVFTTTRDSEAPAMCITKGNRMREIAPTTLSENAMNLQTIMRRYYPLVCSVPIYNCNAFTIVKVPVTPTKWYRQVTGIGNLSEPLPSNVLSWFCRLFTYWRGSLRYKMVFSNTDAEIYCWHVPYEVSNFGMHGGVKEVEIVANMSFAGNCAITHLQGSMEVEVPFYSPYNQLLIDVHGQISSLRTQNGTLYFAIRNKGKDNWSNLNPFTFSLFLSTGEDFILNIVRPPPVVFEPQKVFGDCKGSNKTKAEIVESFKDLGDDSRKVVLPGNTGLKQITALGTFGTCVVEEEPEDKIVTQGLVDWMSGGTKTRVDTLINSTQRTVEAAEEFFDASSEFIDGKLTQVLDNVEKVTSRMEETLRGDASSKIESLFRNAAQKYTIMTAEVIACAGVVLAVRRIFQEPCIANLLTLALSAAGAVGMAVSQTVHDFVGRIVDWAMDWKVRPAQTQALDGPVIDFLDENTNVIVAIVAVLGTVFYSYIFGIIPPLHKVKDAIKHFFEDELEAQGGLMDCMKNAHFSTLGLNAIQKVFDKITDLVKRLLDWLIDRENPSVVMARTAEQFKDKVLKLISDIDTLDYEPNYIAAQHDPLVHNRFYHMMQDVNDLTEASLREKMEPKVVALITECRRRAQAVIKKFEKDCEVAATRYDPFIICLHGESRTGKTMLMRRIAKVCGEVLNCADYKLTYSKSMNDKFWSGYFNQPIVMWDEFGQNRKKAEDYVPEFMTLRGNTPVLLNMSESAEKGRPFTSQVIIMTTNVPYVDYNCISDNTAFRYRRNLMIGVQHRPGHDGHTMEAAQEKFKDWEHAVFCETDCQEERILRANMNLFDVEAIIRERLAKWNRKQMAELEEYKNCDLPRGVVAITVEPGHPDFEAAVEQQGNHVDVAPVNVTIAARQYLSKEAVECLIDFGHEDVITETDGVELEAIDTILDAGLGYTIGATAQAKENFSGCKLVFCKYDDGVELSEDEKFKAELFMMKTRSFHHSVRNRWITAKEAIVNGCKKLYNMALGVFNWCANKLSCFWEEHPRIATALGILSVCGALALMFGAANQTVSSEKDVPSEVDYSLEGAYSSDQAVVKSSRVKLSESGPYNPGAGIKTSRVKLAQGNEDPVAMDIKNVVHNYVYQIRWKVGSKTSCMKAYHVGGHVIIVPFHFFNHANEGDKFELLHRYHPMELIFNTSRMYRYREHDWVMYDCGVRLEPAKFQMKYFVREQTLHKLGTTNAFMLSVSNNGTLTSAFGIAKAIRRFEYTDPKYGDTYSQKGWKTNFATEAGDCGSLLVACNVRADPPGKILGIHVAGRTHEAEGYCVLITREGVEEVWNRIHTAQVQEAPVPGAVLRTLEGVKITPVGDYTIMGVMPANKCPIQPIRTDFVKTPFYQKLSEPEPKKPAHLRQFTNAQGEKVSPLALALTKYGKQTFPFPERDLAKVKNFLTNLCVNKMKHHTGKRVWPITEAVNGIEGVKYADRINMKSSAGWPYQVMHKDKAPGKWDYFDDDGNVVDPLLKYMLEDRISKAKELKRIPSLWRDCLKDETRPVEKVDEGKTRLFTIAPLDFTLAVRMYFMDFVMAFYDMGSKDFFSAVGIDPESYDWTNVYEYLREISNNIVAGDFSTFDGTIPPEVFEIICDIINDWYGDDEESRNVRRVLIMEMIHTLQLVENCVYSTHQGNPSGNPLTVIINTLANVIYMMLAWIKITRETLQKFADNVHMKAYGDDNLIAVSNKYPEFNQESITNFLKPYGIVYTLENKTNEIVNYRGLDEVTFLKRGFRRDAEFGSTFVLPDMEESTLKSFFYYYRKVNDVEEQLQANMLAGLKFACFKGRAYYDKYHSQWSTLMREVNMEPLAISFDEQVDVFLFGAGALGGKIPQARNVSEGMEKFMAVTNNKVVRSVAGMLSAPLYYLCAAFGIGRNSEEIIATDDRWAVSIPSGEGKSYLCKKYPDVFVDHDELLLPVFKEKGAWKSFKEGLPWTSTEARKYDFPSDDRRILLVHHSANTKRKLIGSFITHFPTFVRTNIFQRLSQNKPMRISRDERNLFLLRIAQELEPTLFTRCFQEKNATAVERGFAT